MMQFLESDFEWDETKFELTARAVILTNEYHRYSDVEQVVREMKHLFLSECMNDGTVPFFVGTSGYYITAGKSSFRDKFWVTATLMSSLAIAAANERDSLQKEVAELKAKLAKIAKMAGG